MVQRNRQGQRSVAAAGLLATLVVSGLGLTAVWAGDSLSEGNAVAEAVPHCCNVPQNGYNCYIDSYCDERTGRRTFYSVCAIDNYQPGGGIVGADRDTIASFIDNVTFNYHHYAYDYRVGKGGGCTSCGGGAPGSDLEQLYLQRRHRLRDMTVTPSSFGPGVFSNYDISLQFNLSPNGNSIDVFDPQDLHTRRLFDGWNGDASPKNGVYSDTKTRAIKEIRLLNASNTLVSDPLLATKAELKNWGGDLFRFELISLSGGDVSTGLQLHWPLNEGSDVTATDTSGNGRNGTLAAGATWGTGQSGAGVALSGADEPLTLAGLETLLGGTATLSMWIKTTQVGSSDPALAPGLAGADVAGTTTGDLYWGWLDNGGKLNIKVGSGGSARTQTSINNGQWRHIAMTRDAATGWVTIFVDGLQHQSVQSAKGTIATPVSAIGQIADTAGAPVRFIGQVDDVRIYNRVLTPTDIRDMVGAGQLAGRLTRIEDRNGYGSTLTYKTFTPAEIAASPERQYQLNTVTDSQGRTATFTYRATPVAGRWVVSQIALPGGGRTISYDYADDTHLTRVGHPDGTESTFSYGTNATTQTSFVEYRDAAAEGTSRNKRVHLTNNIVASSGDQNIYNQSSMVVRYAVNGANELSYLNTFSSNTKARIYEGTGRLKELTSSYNVRFLQSGWNLPAGKTAKYSNFTGTLEPSYARIDTAVSGTNLMMGIAKRVIDAKGRQFDYTYDSNSFVTQKNYTDLTLEKFAYNGFKQVTRQEDRLGRVVKYTYDTRGNLTKKEVGLKVVSGVDTPQPEYAIYHNEYYPSGHVNQFLLRYEYDAVASAAAQATNNRRREFLYDAQQRLIEIKEPDDTGAGYHTASTFTYDAVGRLHTSADALGRTAIHQYDDRDRCIKITYMDGSTEETVYGTGLQSNLVVQSKDRNGNLTTFAYDAHGRVVTTVTAANDPSVAVTRSCIYRPGTNLLAECTDQGERTVYGYDYRHRLVSTTVQPRVGKTLTSTITYANNLPTVSTDPYGRKTYAVYRASDSAVIRTVQGTVPADGVTDPATIVRDLGPNAKYIVKDVVLDAGGQVIEQIDGRGISHTTAYDSRGRAVETNEAFNTPDVARTLTFYDVSSNVTEVHHPRSFDPTDSHGGMFITKATYTRRNLLASRTEAFGRTEAATVSYTYNNDRTENTVVDARGNTWTTLWSPCCADRQVGSLDPISAGTSQQHDSAGNVTFRQVLHGATVFNDLTTRYDARHRPTMQTVWLVPPPVVDSQNPPIAGEGGVPAANGLTTRYTYDDDLDDGAGLDASFASLLGGLSLGAGSDGAAVLLTNPEGERTLSVNDGLGRTVRVMQLDAAGAAMNNVTTTNDAVVAVAGYGDVVETAVANALGHSNRARTDAVGRALEMVDAENHKTVAAFDANGNRVTLRDANSVGMDCFYDFRNRETSCTDTRISTAIPASGDTTARSYDKHGNAIATTDAKGQVATALFDARDRRVRHTNRLGGATQFGFDGNSNMIALTDGESRTTSYEFDARNLQTKETYPDHVSGQSAGDPSYGIVECAYDGARRLIRRTDQFGDTCALNYDRANRMTSRDYRLRVSSPAGPIADKDEFTYDKTGRMLTATSGRYSNTVTLAYDDAGRKASEALTIGGQTYVVASAYDFANRLAALTYPDGSVVTRSYSSRNQLAEVQYKGSMVGQFQYDAGSRETSRVFGNGLVTSRTYLTDNMAATIDTPSVTSFTYAYDANKNKTSEAIGGVMAPYGFSTGLGGYDADNRLLQWNRTDSLLTQSWNLSLVGDWNTFTTNSVPEVRAHNAAHEITGPSSIGHDAKGNMTLRPDGRSLAWDFDNQLRSTALAGASTQFKYDAFQRRVSKEHGGATLVYVSDGDQEIAEYTLGASPLSPVRSYVYGSYVDEPLLIATGGTKHYCHADSLFSVAAATDATGAVVERYAYSAYGAPTVLAADGLTTLPVSAIHNPWLFTGRRLDSEQGAYYFRARYFVPGLGRFASRDPLEYTLTPHLYSYVSNNPANRVDPTGMQEEFMYGSYSLNDVAGIHPEGPDASNYKLRNMTPTERGEFYEHYDFEFVKTEKKKKDKVRVQSVRVPKSCTVVLFHSHWSGAIFNPRFAEKPLAHACNRGKYGYLTCWGKDWNTGPGLIPGLPVINGLTGAGSAEEIQAILNSTTVGAFIRTTGKSANLADVNAGLGVGPAAYNTLLTNVWNAAIAEGTAMLRRTETFNTASSPTPVTMPCCQSVNVVFECIGSPKMFRAAGLYDPVKNPSGFCGRGVRLSLGGGGVIQTPFKADFKMTKVK